MTQSPDTIILLGHPRSGTHLLLGLLEANGYGYVGELFAETLYLAQIPTNKTSGIKAIRQKLNKSRKNGLVACSIMTNHLDKICGHIGFDQDRLAALESMFSPCSYVLVKREDIVAQAVSFVCSKHSGRYHSHERAKRPLPPYNEMRIACEIQLLRSPEMTWGDIPAALHAPEVTYEELSLQPSIALGKISKSIGKQLDTFKQRRFQKVAGRLEQEYIEAFKASQVAATLLG